MNRTAGEGSITEIKTGFWIRFWDNGSRKSGGVHPSREIAEATLAQLLHKRSLRGGHNGSATTFATFAALALDNREGDDIRGVKGERNRFKNHLANSAIADKLVRDITPADIADLRRALGKKLKRGAKADGRTKISKGTVQACLVLVSGIFEEAKERGVRVDNPCAGVRKSSKKRAAADEDTEEKWTFLTGDEQGAIAACAEIPEWARLMMAFAWGAGLRQGEQWNLELRDVHCGKDEKSPHIIVRFGSKGQRPKNKKIRRTPLFGAALAAARRWLEILPTYCPKNPAGLMFPGPWGARRGIGAPSKSTYSKDANGKVKIGKKYLMPGWLAAAGVERGVRWHDLRHTCASSLVNGTWGRTWSLEEVKEMLGHSSVKVTERYAHPAQSVLEIAARETGYAQVMNDSKAEAKSA